MAASETSRGRLVAICFGLFTFSLFLTSYSARNPWVANVGAVMLGEVIHPIQRVFRGTAQGIEGVWVGYVALRGVGQENEKLKERLSVLESDNSRLREVEHEVVRLRELLGGSQELGLSGVSAEVIGYDPSNWIQAVTVNRGSVEGVVQGMAAIQGNYVVGKVIAVGRRTAQVLLLVDPSSGVDALVQSSRVRGVVEGNGRNGAQLQYVSPQEVVKVGERVITSGMDGVFPKGLVVGVVSEVEKSASRLFQRITLKPSVKFRRLESVLLVGGNAIVNSLDVQPLPKSNAGAKK